MGRLGPIDQIRRSIVLCGLSGVLLGTDLAVRNEAGHYEYYISLHQLAASGGCISSFNSGLVMKLVQDHKLRS